MIAFMRRNTVTRTKPTADDDGWDFFFKKSLATGLQEGMENSNKNEITVEMLPGWRIMSSAGLREGHLCLQGFY